MQRAHLTPSGEVADGGSATPAAPLDLSVELLARKVTKRESKRMKAARLLVTGRLRIRRMDDKFIHAECKGDSGAMYELLWKDGLWTCSCAARTDCSHLNALWAVVAV